MTKKRGPTPSSRLGNSNHNHHYDNSSQIRRARVLKHFEPCSNLSALESSFDSHIEKRQIGLCMRCRMNDKLNSPWEEIVRFLSANSSYEKMNDDQRCEFLEKFISVDLSPTQHKDATWSLYDYLWGDEVTNGEN